MAENESLDLGSNPRMRVVFDAFRNGSSCPEVASKLENALTGGLRNAFKQFRGKGVTLADFLKSRDCPQDLRQLLRKVKGHDSYKYDFLGPAETVNRLPERRLAYLKAFLMQVAQLRGIEASDRLPSAFERHVVGTGIVPKGQSQGRVIQLLARYRDEWMVIASAARESGLAWAKLLDPRRAATQGVSHASA